ncbi:hypothetical protein L4D76_14780 [Photobacterium sagamiensis]|uniref:hypothetical protein n=1 Tax=Photobacterium sagamiensis TaxID=2910241 RepID=UPI003D13E54E
MRKTNIALLVAVVVSSPIVFASGDWYHPDPTPPPVAEPDIVLNDIANENLAFTATNSFNKDLKINDSFKTDDDALIMYDMNNTDIDKDTSHSFNTFSAIDNSKDTYTKTFTFTLEKNVFKAESEIEGEIEDSEVTYGGACCDNDNDWGGGWYDKSYGGGQSAPSGVMVTQSNDMTNAFKQASGINIAGQNAGNNSLVQQSVSTNAVLSK